MYKYVLIIVYIINSQCVSTLVKPCLHLLQQYCYSVYCTISLQCIVDYNVMRLTGPKNYFCRDFKGTLLKSRIADGIDLEYFYFIVCKIVYFAVITNLYYLESVQALEFSGPDHPDSLKCEKCVDPRGRLSG